MKRIFSLAVLLITCYLSLVTSSSAHSGVQVIKMTPDAFEPSEVIIDENSTVIFVNQDKVKRWPASNLHPTHELYPEFDTKKTIQPGESWSFKPKKPGVWKYHDHENPHLRGTLTVTAEEKTSNLDTVANNSTTNLVSSLKNFFASFVSLIQTWITPLPQEIAKPEEFKNKTPNEQFTILAKFSKAKGGKAVWEFIEKTYSGEAGSAGNIHDLAHLAGKLIYEDVGVKGIANCSATFAFGCYHGLLDSAFKTSLDDLEEAEKECQKLGRVDSGPYGSCVHGTGHGVASFHQSQDIKAALSSCGKLASGQSFCFDGVFMEFTRSASPSFYSKEKPFYPCDVLENEFGDTYSLPCGRNQPTVLISRLGHEFKDVVSLCTTSVLSDKFKSSCFDALGFMLASTQDPEKIISGCKTIGTSDYQSLCFKSAAGELIFQNVPSWQEKANQVCAASPTFKLCHDNLQRLINEYGRNKEKTSLVPPAQAEAEYVKSQMKICLDNGGKDDCYKTVSDDFSQKLGLQKTLAIFAANEKSPEIYSRCHEATHYLSRNEYQITGSVAQVYSMCNSTCHGGCYHGTLEQYLKDKGLALDKLNQEFPKICDEVRNSTPLVYNECLHGLGHAAMFVTDMEVRQSLSLCDTLEDKNAQERCFSGIFMENSSSSTNNDHPARYVKADDPLFPCNALEQKYAQICYRYQSSHFALITNHDWSKTAALCLKVPAEYQNDCVRTIGTNQVGFTQDTNLMRKNCALMPTTHFQEVCVLGVISSFAYRFVGGIDHMADFCTNLQKDFQQACARQIGTSVVDWSKDEQEALLWCEKITNSQFVSWCKAAVSS